MKIDIFNTDKNYGLIYADPPWKQSKGGLRKVRPNQTRRLDYPTLSLEAIKEILQTSKTLGNNNHVLFCWAIDKYLPETEAMLKELGYKIHARMIWDKTNGVAPAFTVRYSHEYLLYCYYGKFIPITTECRGKFCTVFREKATKHSKKPLVAYEMMEAMYPNLEKIELFARNHRYGWDCWGNEC